MKQRQITDLRAALVEQRDPDILGMPPEALVRMPAVTGQTLVVDEVDDAPTGYVTVASEQRFWADFGS